MTLKQSNNIEITNTTIDDLKNVLWLFEQAIKLQGKSGYKVWEQIDEIALANDIENKLQYKIVNDLEILCIFSIQLNDPFIWRERDQSDAIYLHRIVVNPKFKGQKQFQRVLDWGIQFCKKNNLNFVRMDTWADNLKIIEYYQSFGFKIIENFKTGDTLELPMQNRNLDVTLLEMNLNK